MFIKLLSISVFQCVFLLLTANDNSKLQKKMESDGIVPQILEKTPPTSATIRYPSDRNVIAGQELTPREVKDEPQVKWEAHPRKYYTLLMFDPDAPSREDPKLADVKHWLVVNILGEDVSTGDVIAEYFGSGPPKGTGLHRYIFLIFEQKDKLDFDEPRSLKLSRANRLKWSMKAFVEKYDLGAPVAGNYFKAQWDPYVDERNQYVTNN